MTTNSTLLTALKRQERSYGNVTFTDNLAITPASTLAPVLDFFSRVGGLRGSRTATDLFAKAYADDPLLARKAMFYTRDIRGGLGERATFTDLLEWLALHDPAALIANVHLIPEYGRWDDGLVLLGYPEVKGAFIHLVNRQLRADILALSLENGNVSLCAKWMPSENASAPKTKRLARIMADGLGLTPKQYRVMLSTLRKRIGIVETLLTQGRYQDIDYSRVPSQAMRLYGRGGHAFRNHDDERFGAYMASVERGEEKINADTLYPHQLLGQYMTSSHWGYSRTPWGQEDRAIEALWKALPNYMGDENILVVADTSGSMYSDYNDSSVLPILVSLSLAIYAAERNTGLFHDNYIVFSSRPKLHTLKGDSLSEKAGNMPDIVSSNTNLQAVFRLILDAAVRGNVPDEEMPAAIFIISDMQFDRTDRAAMSNHDAIKAQYAAAGYEAPLVVYWNVNARGSQHSPVEYDESGVVLVSGASASTFKAVLEGGVEELKDYTPERAMIKILTGDRYAAVV